MKPLSRPCSYNGRGFLCQSRRISKQGLETGNRRRFYEHGCLKTEIKLQVCYHFQVLAQEVYLYCLLGTYSYIMLVDLDEFFITRVPGQISLHYYAKQCCDFHTTCGPCHFEFMYFPTVVWTELWKYYCKVSIIEQKAVGKSIYILPAIWDVGCQCAEVFIKGYRCREFPMEGAYVTHNRTGVLVLANCNNNDQIH